MHLKRSLFSTSILLSSLLCTAQNVDATSLAREKLKIPTFNPATSLLSTNTAGVVAPASADLDADGDLDLLVGMTDGTVRFYENTGHITTAAYTETTHATVDAIDVGTRAVPCLVDLDKDGDVDLLVGGADGVIRYFKNTGSATAASFVEQTGSNNPFDGLGVASKAYPTAGDFDSNGTIDVFVGAGNGTVKVLQNTGTVVAPVFTVFSDANFFLTTADFGSDAAPILGDIDSDTDVDLVVGNAAGTYALYVNSRAGYQGETLTDNLQLIPGTTTLYEPGVKLRDFGWQEVEDAINPFAEVVMNGAASGCFADIDGDGDADFISGDTSGALSLSVSNKVKKLQGIRGLYHAPEEADADAEFVPYSSLALHPRRSSNDKLGSLASPATINAYWQPPAPHDVDRVRDKFWSNRAVGDIDGDGLLDFVTLETSFGHETYDFGNFSAEPTKPNKTSIAWRKADGWNDWGWRTYSDATWFVDYHDSVPDHHYGHITLADMDADGDLDLIVGVSPREHNFETTGEYLGGPDLPLAYYENTGDATQPNFVRRENAAENLVSDIMVGGDRESASPEFADLDGDGDLDCIMGMDFGAIQYWENTGTSTNPSFTLFNDTYIGNGDWKFTQPQLADFDKDGDLDLVVHKMKRYDTHPYVKTNLNALHRNDYPGQYLFFINKGNARNPNFAQVSQYADWSAQEQSGNPIYKIYKDAKEVWPSFYDELHQADDFRRSDGIQRLTLGDFNQDGYPDVHIDELEYPDSFILRTMDESVAPTATLAIVTDGPYYTHEPFSIRVSFDEHVDRVKKEAFALYFDDASGEEEVDLSAVVVSGARTSFTLNFDQYPFEGGTYRLELAADGVHCHDVFGNATDSTVSVSFLMEHITDDVQVAVSGPASADFGDQVSYVVEVSNNGGATVSGAPLTLFNSPWLHNAQITNIVTVGGASQSLSAGAFGITATDTVNLPIFSKVQYHIQGTVSSQAANSLDQYAGEIQNMLEIKAEMTPGVGLTDQIEDNNIGSAFTVLNVENTYAGSLGQFVDTGYTRIYQDTDLVDINGDGYLDLLLQGEYHYRLNDGAGNFGELKVFPKAEVDLQGETAVGDLDNDGDLDVVLGSAQIFGYSGTSILLSDGAADPTYTETQVVVPSSTHDLRVHLADADSDGDLDIFVGASLFYNDGTGTFGNPLHISDENILAVADFNADGRPDVIDSTGIKLQNYRGVFTQVQGIGSLRWKAQVAVGDIDNDGDLDFVVAGDSTNFNNHGENAIYLNDGDGSFTKSTFALSSLDGSDVALADFNKDGWLDILLMIEDEVNDDTNTYEHRDEFLYINKGDGSFAIPLAINTLQGTHTSVGDIDNDGVLDVIMSNHIYQTGPTERIIRFNGVSTAPNIVLSGDGVVYLEVGENFVEPGVSANDLVDGAFADEDIVKDYSALNPQVAGTYEITYSVTDSDNHVSTASRFVVYHQPPVANAGNDFVVNLADLSSNIVLDGTASADPDGGLLQYEWSVVSGPWLRFSDPASPQPKLFEVISDTVHTVQLTVTDEGGLTHTDTILVEANSAPVIVADHTHTTTSVGTLDAAGTTDAAGDAITYTWSYVSGGAYQFVNGINSGQQVQVEALVTGKTYIFRLDAEDEHGANSSKNVYLVAHLAPVARAGADQVINANSVNLDGSASFDQDVSGRIKKYLWSVDPSSPSSVVIPNDQKSLANPTISNLVDGEEYVFHLTVTDNHGATAADTVHVRVNDAPTAVPGTYTQVDYDFGMTASFDGSGSSDSDGSIVSYKWEITERPPFSFTQPNVAFVNGDNVANPTVSGLRGGENYTFRLTVTDDLGKQGFSDVTVFIDPRPRIYMGNDQRINVTTVNLQATAYDDVGNVVSQAWSVAPNSQDSVAIPASEIGKDDPVIPNLQRGGNYTFQFSATDNAGQTASDTVNVSVNAFPVANAGPDQIINGLSVTLDGSGSTDDRALTYAWSVDASSLSNLTIDPAEASKASPSISNLADGSSYVFLLTVTDEEGESSTDTVKVDINGPPVADAGEDISTGNRSITLDATDSYDTLTDAVNLRYAWSEVTTKGVSIENAETSQPTITGLTPGLRYEFEVTVTDEEELTDTDTVVVSLPLAHYTDSGLGALDQPDVAQWGTHAINANTAVFKTVFDYTAEMASSTKYVTLLTSTSSQGTSLSIMVKEEEVWVYLTAPGTRYDATIIADHGLTAPMDDVKISVVIEMDDPEYVEIFVNGESKRKLEFDIYTTWSDAMNTRLGDLAAVHPTFDFYPDENIHFAVYQASGANLPEANSVDAILQLDWNPDVDAGADQHIDSTTVALDTTASDKDGTIVSYAWSIDSSSVDALSLDPVEAAKEDPSFAGLARGGDYTFLLTVTDNKGSVSTDTVNVTVNELPIAVAAKGDVVADSVSLNATASSDPDGSIVSYNWQQLNGAALSIDNDSIASPTITGLTAGTVYSFLLTVTDNDGGQNTDTVEVYINRDPIAELGGDYTVAGGVVTLDATNSSDPEGSDLTYLWDLEFGAPVTFSDDTSATPTVSGLIEGHTYSFRVTVTDTEGGSSTDTVSVYVPKPHYTYSGSGLMDVTTPSQWGTHDITGDSVAFKVVFDFTPELDARTNVNYFLILIEQGAGVAMWMNGDNVAVYHRSENGDVAYVQRPHGLSSTPEATNNVSLVSVLNKQNNTIALYLNGNLLGQSAATYGNTWSEATIAGLGYENSQPIPGGIDFAVYQLSGTGKPAGNNPISAVNPNWKPVADAGPNQAVANSTITLDGSASYDLDSEIQSYAWRELNGKAVSFTDASAASTQVSGLVDGENYSFELTVTDEHGALETDTVDVSYAEPPMITLLGAADLDHEAGTTYSDSGATASDAVDGDLTASIQLTGSVNVNVPGVYTLEYDVTDSDGLVATTVTRTVTVEDTIAPVITVTGNAVMSHEAGTAYNDQGATASDSLDGDLTSAIKVAGAVGASLGEYILTYSVSDAAGNPAEEKTRTVTVEDTTAPVITLSGPATVVHQAGTSYTDAGASAADLFSGDLTAVMTVTGSVDSNVIGEYTISFNVSDASGNAATTVTRTVNVVDSNAPVITLAGNATITHQAGVAYTDAGVSANDSFDGDLTAEISSSGSVNANVVGQYILRFNVSDAAGNSAQEVTRTVTVADTLAPTLILQGEAIVSVEHGASYSDAGATASDLFDGDLTSAIQVNGTVDTSKQGAYNLIYQVSDAAGNAAQQVSRTVIVGSEPEPYDAWLENNQLVEGGTQEQRDEMLIKFALAQDPVAQQAQEAYDSILDEDQNLSLSFKVRQDAQYLTPKIEYSYDLVTWYIAEHGVDGVIVTNTPGGYGLDADGIPVDKVDVYIPDADLGKVFTRLAVTRPE